MALPGGTGEHQIAGKVRIGKKQGGRATSVDHFIFPDDSLSALVGEKPSELIVRFVDSEPSLAFATGLEWWVAKNGVNTLACYTKDGGDDPTALRYRPYLDQDDEKRGAEVGNQRQPIACRFRECPHFKAAKQCGPVGRLTFQLENDPERRVWRLDTKSWNTVEAIEPVLARYGDGLHRHVFRLTVAFESKGQKRFPVIRIEEVQMEINTEADVAKADALVALTGALERGEDSARVMLADYLDATRPGWRDNAELVDRILAVGPEVAVRKIVEAAKDDAA